MLRKVLIVSSVAAISACVESPPVATSTAPLIFESQNADRALIDDLDAVLNAERRARGLPSLQEAPALMIAADRHARDMASRGYFSHQSPEGRSHADRITMAGYCRAATAENIARGQMSEREVMAGWMGSAGHRKNMLNSNYRFYGFAEAGGFWVLTLASDCI